MIDLMHAGSRSFSDGDRSVDSSKLLLKALQYSNQIDLPIFQNARDSSLSENAQMHEGLVSTGLGLRGEPSISEELIINRDLDILKYSGGKLHFSMVSTAGGIDLVKKAKKKGLDVTCDVSIHHLLFNDSTLSQFNSIYKSTPPFRSEADRKALIKGVIDGTVDAICSGHRPQDQESKKLEFDLAEPGAISLQTFLNSLLQLDLIPFEILIEKVTKGPRNILNLEETGVKIGSKAKLAILDKKASWHYDSKTNKSKSNNSPFFGSELHGKVFGTINGEFVTIHK